MKPVIEMSVAELARSFDELSGEFQPETYLARGANSDGDTAAQRL